MTSSAALRGATRALASAAVIAAGAVVSQNLPAGSEIYAPFPVAGVLGEAAGGRGITATVTGVQIAPEVLVTPKVGAPKSFSAIGQWVVVQTSMRPGDRTEFAHADLTAGPRTYLPTDRLPPGSTLGGTIQPGFVSRGAWVFDVAPDALDSAPRDGPVTLRAWVGDGRLDSRLEINLVLGDSRVVRSQRAEVSAPEVVPG